MKRITTREILDFYDNTLRKTVKNKDKLIKFEMNKSLYVNYIVDVLNGDKPLKHYYNIFLIYEPKPRLIMSLNMVDKIINHYFTETVLVPKLDKKMDDRNVATRKGKGSSCAIRLVRKYIEYYKRNKKSCYILKIDISKFFYSIDHEVLKKMLIEDLDSDEYAFCSKIIDSTNYDYINDKINRILERNTSVSLPYYEYSKGLPIGNLSSQCLSVYYLNRLDHYMVHDLHLKHYVRYMDDFLIFHEDKEYLEKCRDIIIDKLINEYKLNINYKKTSISNLNNGFSFLGYRFFIKKNKTIMIIRKESLNNINHKVKRNNYLYKNGRITFEKFFSSSVNYLYTYKCGKVKLRRIINNSLNNVESY